jgi:hypothetical protein
MRKILGAMFVVVLAITSCKKSDNDAEPFKPSYHIDGISDVTIQKMVFGGAPYAYLNLSLVYENSEQERVTLSIDSVPPKLFTRFSTKSGIPSFTSSLFLADSGVAPGVYTLKLNAEGANSGKKSFDINLTVLAAPDCSSDITGTGYTSQSNCASASPYLQDITASGESGKVVFSNFDGSGTQIYGYVNCGSYYITIPQQVVNNITYQGSGNYQKIGTQRQVNINYSKVGSTGSTTCSLYMSR